MIEELVSNPVFAGVVGGASVSALLYQMKAVPLQIWNFAKRQLTTYIEIDNHEEMFDRFMVYLTNLSYVNKTRWLRMVEFYDEGQQKWVWKPTFGSGWHIFKDNGVRYLLHRNTENGDKGSMTLKKRETLTVRVMGRDQKPIRELVKRAEKVYENSSSIRVYVWHQGGYILVDRKPVRDFSTVYLPKEQKEKILTDITKFTESRDIYLKRGIPYKRGYLFKGPPGTGKTTLAFVLASLFKKPLYIINLNTAGGDTGLQAAFNFIESGAFVVIEDIDAATITHERAGKTTEENSAELDKSQAVTLSGLLNAIDGVGSRDNRILIFTSNHAEKLDRALIRPGRIDLIEEIGLLNEPEAIKMAEAFGRDENWLKENITLPMSPAELQNNLLISEK